MLKWHSPWPPLSVFVSRSSVDRQLQGERGTGPGLLWGEDLWRSILRDHQEPWRQGDPSDLLDGFGWEFLFLLLSLFFWLLERWFLSQMFLLNFPQQFVGDDWWSNLTRCFRGVETNHQPAEILWNISDVSIDTQIGDVFCFFLPFVLEKFWRRQDKEHPLFLFHAFHLLHTPLQVPKYYFQKIEKDVIKRLDEVGWRCSKIWWLWMITFCEENIIRSSEATLWLSSLVHCSYGHLWVSLKVLTPKFGWSSRRFSTFSWMILMDIDDMILVSMFILKKINM